MFGIIIGLMGASRGTGEYTPPTPPSGSALLLEDGSSALLLEDGASQLMLED